MNKKGFTLVEILIVVLILAALAAITIPRIFQNSSKPSGDPAPTTQVEKAPIDSEAQKAIQQ